MTLSARPAEALFAATGTGTITLLLGSRAGPLADIIAELGGRTVTSMVPGIEVGGPRPDEPGKLCVAADPAGHLPFADASFDSVLAPYLSAEEAGAPGRAHSTRDFVEECARVLKPSGRLVLSVPNPLIAALARWASARRRALHHVAPSPLPYSRWWLTRLLRSSGFQPIASFVQWPRVGAWDRLVPETDFWQKRRLAMARAAPSSIAKAIALLGLAPGRFIVAQRHARPSGGVDRAPTPLLEAIIRPTPWDGSVSSPLLVAKGTGIVLATVDGTFFKIALTREASQRHRAELATQARLLQSPISESMLQFVRAGRIGTLSFAAYPAAEPVERSNEVERNAAQVEAFELLSADAEMRGLDGTSSWTRILAGPSRVALEDLGAGDLCRFLERTAGNKRVMTGTVHGDLHLQNIMRFAGRTVLIDWDCSEDRAPLLLDRCNGVYRLLARRLRPKLGERWHSTALRMMADRHPSAPLLACIDEAVGELAWPEVILLHVLNTISWRTLRHQRADPALQRQVREHLNLCRALLERPPDPTG